MLIAFVVGFASVSGRVSLPVMYIINARICGRRECYVIIVISVETSNSSKNNNKQLYILKLSSYERRVKKKRSLALYLIFFYKIPLICSSHIAKQMCALFVRIHSHFDCVYSMTTCKLSQYS